MKRKQYEREMRVLHGELVAMQEWVKASGAKICIVFEGRDTAGKGGTIRRITERVSPRVFRVVALPAPTEREKSQMYIQRYVPHFPAAGEVVIFDRSWYNRAGVERVMGFCQPEETERFLELAPGFEKAMTDAGIVLLKYWLEVSADEQTRRLESRIHDPRKIWKLSALDLKSYSRWYDYSRARDAMFAATDTAWAPWYIAHTDDKKRGRLEHHQPPAQPGPLQAPRPPRRHTAQVAAGQRLRGAGPAVAVHPGTVLDSHVDRGPVKRGCHPGWVMTHRPGQPKLGGNDPGDGEFGTTCEGKTMTDIDAELGPVDYLVVAFPAGQADFSGEMASELRALMDSGTVRVLDLVLVTKDMDGVGGGLGAARCLRLSASRRTR